MAILYPAQIDTTSSLPPIADGVSGVNGSTINPFRQAIIAIEHQLGVVPAGVYGTVRARLDYMDTLLNNQQTPLGPAQDGYVLTWVNVDGMWEAKPIPGGGGGSNPVGPAGGDLTGTYPNPIVAQLQGSIVLSGTPSNGQVLQATSVAAATWVTPPVSLPPSGPASGDLGQNYPAPVVASLATNPLQLPILSTPHDGYVLVWNNNDGYITALPPASVPPTGPASGDLNGFYPSPTLGAIQGISLVLSTLNNGDIISYNGSSWVNTTALTDLINNFNTLQTTVTNLQTQVTALANGNGFSLSISGAGTGNVFYDGSTTISYLTT